jgi:hypothetical protein
MNYLGKGLVFLNLLVSLFLFTWSGTIYLQAVDWGWKDPRQRLDGELVASEIDKRTALIKELLRLQSRADLRLTDTSDPKTQQLLPGLITTWISYQRLLAANHLWYQEKLAELASAPGNIQVLYPKYDKIGGLALDAAGRPIFDRPATLRTPTGEVKLEKSYAVLRNERAKLLKEIDQVQVNIRQWVEKQKELTVKLNGTQDAAGKEILPGLYALLARENDIQSRLKEEKNYLEPLWINELVNAQLLLERQASLRVRLAELQAVRAAQK